GKPKGEFGDQTVTSGDGLFVVGSGEEDDSKGADVSKVRGLSNILVEVRCEEEVLRQLTDQKGRFSFEDLRPGKWTLTVYDHDLPAYHYLEDEQFQFDLKPGQEKDVTVRVLPRLRPIQIIDEGALGQEKK
ncbi:MAG: carboxypeptidase-like regulatory domain-containing protein, partial [Candidatus Zixiibacteriota bacterium]